VHEETAYLHPLSTTKVGKLVHKARRICGKILKGNLSVVLQLVNQDWYRTPKYPSYHTAGMKTLGNADQEFHKFWR
jgi:hypothetical protein